MSLTPRIGSISVLAYGASGRVARRAALAGLVLCGLASLAGPATAAEGWLTDYEQALAAAEQSGRPVLTIFTGSDWCPHCRTLEHNVLHTDTFREWASDRLVLLMIDLPQHGISAEERKARSRVCVKYGVRIFPSALLLAPDGRKIAIQTGYTGQSAVSWVAAMSGHLPPEPRVAESSGNKAAGFEDLASLDDAVATARSARKPVLVMVSRGGEDTGSSSVVSLMNDPEFDALARENFVVATVPAGTPGMATGSGNAAVDALLAEADDMQAAARAETDEAGLGVDLIVTDDGRTPLHVLSGQDSPQRVVTGLRRFLAGRQTTRR
jgi:thiol-disulfide isomerase/thioredoxin